MNSEFWLGKRVLVTGGAGFIGSHLCETLLKQGAIVTAVDNFLTGRRENIASLLATAGKNFTLIEADVIQPPQEYLPADYKVDVVLHFASPASPPRYQAHPVATYLVNSVATHQLLTWLHHNAPKARFLFASTSEVYGDPKVHPQVESYWGNVNPNGTRSCYDESKRLGETISGVFHRSYGLDTRLVRIFNTYGPRMDPTDGRVIPNFIWQALHGEPLSIYGTGTQTRSFCYVADLVEAILAVAADQNSAGATYNIGNPDEYTVAETAKTIAEMIGVPLETKDSELPADDPTRRRPDISKVREATGWQPKTSLAEGLVPTIEYFKQHQAELEHASKI